MSTRTYLCANPDCKMQLINPIATRPADLPEINDLIVCGACRIPSVVTLLGTRLMTEEETKDMPKEVQDELIFALRALDAKLKSS